MPIAEKIPSSPDQGSACVGKRCVLCTVACRDRSSPVQHVTQHVTHTQFECHFGVILHTDGITSSTEGSCLHHHTTPHHTTPHHTTPHHTTPHHTTPHHTTPHHTTPHHTTPHHTTPHLASPASRHECSLPHACTYNIALAYAAFHVCSAFCAVMQALTCKVPCLRKHVLTLLKLLCKTSVSYCLVLHIVFCPMQLSFVLQMAAAWSSGAVA